MKAAVARVYRQPLQIEQVPVPTVVPGRILVKVAACGVCHTDLHAINGDWPVKATLPLIPGHEGVGTRLDLAESLAFATEGRVKVRYRREPLENINLVLNDMRVSSINGRVVLDIN